MPTGSKKGVQGADDGSEDEENQRCPICLNTLSPSERAVPDGCSHFYCFKCILRWAQMVQVCPVDRRPFNAICRQNPLLGCIKIPVKTPSLTNTDVCNNKETIKEPSKEETTEPGGKHRKRALAKLKCQRRETDCSAQKKKKVRRETCRSQLITSHTQPELSVQQGETFGMLTHIVSESVVPEEEPVDEEWRQCRRNVAEYQWLPSSRNMTSILSRHCPRAPILPQQPQFIQSTSPCPLRSGFSVHYGKACAVTCPKGEGRKSTRGSGSKNSTNQEQNLTSRRSSRRRKSGNEEPVFTQPQHLDSDSSSPAGSASSDMHASTSKGRQAGKQKPGSKRKGGAKKEDCSEDIGGK